MVSKLTIGIIKGLENEILVAKNQQPINTYINEVFASARKIQILKRTENKKLGVKISINNSGRESLQEIINWR